MDKAAEAIIDIATKQQKVGYQTESASVFQVTSTSHTTSYQDALVMAKSAGLYFRLVEPAVWLQELRTARDLGKEHSCLQMLETWERNVRDLAMSARRCNEADITRSAEVWRKAPRPVRSLVFQDQQGDLSHKGTARSDDGREFFACTAILASPRHD